MAVAGQEGAFMAVAGQEGAMCQQGGMEPPGNRANGGGVKRGMKPSGSANRQQNRRSQEPGNKGGADRPCVEQEAGLPSSQQTGSSPEPEGSTSADKPTAEHAGQGKKEVL